MTATALTFNGRLPGVDCNPALPATETAIRLDVAAFVGFAERGPLDTPVAVEDINQYRAVFGGDVVLATDVGIPVYANLPGAVEAFFDNGGRRCYVVRVAGPDAAAAQWRLPGMRLWLPEGAVTDVYIDAAWAGAWSQGYGVGTQLLSQPLAVTAPYTRTTGAAAGRLQLSPGSLLLVQPGDLLRLDLGPLRAGLYVTVTAVDRVAAAVTVGVEVAYDGDLLLGSAAVSALPAMLPVVAAYRLQLDLITQEVVAGVAQLSERWTSLGFNPGGTGPSWLDVVQPVDNVMPDQTRSMLLRADAATVHAAGFDGLFLPVGMDQLGSAAEFVAVATDPSGVSAVTLGADGLTTYDPVRMFLDPHLIGTTVSSLIPDADALTVLSSQPLQLIGIHALLGIDEVAIISVPDALHVGWSPAPPPVTQPPTVTMTVTPPPDYADFRQCCPPTAPAPAPAPVMVAPPAPTAPPYPLLDDPAGYDPTPLGTVHSALIQMCAARADAVAILTVPAHFDTAAVLAWLQDIESRSADTLGSHIVMSPLSYAGFWHPWLRIVEPTSPALAALRNQPADGFVAGMVAARELARGVWVAPANVPLRAGVSLSQAISATDTIRLFNVHANLLRTQPGVISCLSSHTLSSEPTLLQLSVRRLIILIRKIALQEGSRYVFDANTDRFRQLVRMRFQRILGVLAQLGALAAYQVVTDGGINTDDDIDNGRLIVVLQIAPTIPIEFITITLVKTGEGLLDVVVG